MDYIIEWKYQKLSDVADIILGQSPKSENYNVEGDGLPLIQGNADIKNRVTKPRQFTNQITKTCKIGDIIISVRAPVGEVAKSNHNACIGRGVAAIRSKYQNEFLYQYLMYYETKWGKLAQGSTFSAISGNDIRNLKIPQLENKEAGRIAGILSTWDRAIHLKSIELSKAQELKKYYIQKLFSDYELKTIRMKEILIETKEKANGDELVFSVSVHKGLINQIEHLGRSYAAENTGNYNAVEFGNIVYTKSPTGSFPYGIIKQSLIKDRIIVSPLYGVFKPLNLETSIILDAYFESPIKAKNFLKPIIQKGAKNTINITNKTFLNGKIRFPINKKTIKTYANLLSANNKCINLLEYEIEQLDMQKKGLMQRLLTGQVRVQA